MNDAYALLDCGNERRLETLGGVVVARPAPAAAFPPGLGPEAWRKAAMEFTREGGWLGQPPADWSVELNGVRMGLRPAAGGQVGVFPEHAAVAEEVAERLGADISTARILNLFAHTGLATLRLASAGSMEVAHVDAAAAAVRAARENAALSGLAAAPIRWLTDDAATFMRREAKRGKNYQAIVADPPSYGRAGKAEWKLDRDLPRLLDLAAELLKTDGRLLCLTCHSEGWDGAALARQARRVLPDWGEPSVKRLHLRARDGGNDLPAGWAVFLVRDGE